MTENSASVEASLRNDRRLSKVLLWATSNPAARRTLAQAARIAGLERTYFSRYSRDVTGITFRCWNTWLRIDLAKSLLTNGCLKITAIAPAVGYADVTTLARNFRRCEDMSPR